MKYKENDYINHARFGVGRIVSIIHDNPQVLVVDFDGDERNLALDNRLLSQLLPLPEETDNTNEEVVISDIETAATNSEIKKTRTQGNNETVLDSSNPVSYKTMREAINSSIGKELGDWRSACWPTQKGNGHFRIWFPQLANTKQGKLVAATNDCVNILSDDWDTLIYDDLRGTNEEIKFRDVKNLIFAREPNKGPYIFRGVYLLDQKESARNHHVYKRIGKKVRMIGHPAYNFKIIEDSKPGKKGTVPSINEKPIISFACGKSYDLINETHVHAHPLANYYPSTVYPYLMARAKGGKTDYLYKVVDYIDLDPKDKNLISSLPPKYDSIKDYYNKRIAKMGFSKTDLSYRFYVLEPIHRFNPVFVLIPNTEHYKLYSFDEIGIENPEGKTKYVNIEELKNYIRRFVEYVHSQEHNTMPIDFINPAGFLAKAESYKARIAREAREMLKIPEWDESWIGTGKIAERICKAMDMSGNLVFPPNKMNFKDHFDVERSEYDSNSERAIYNIYCGKNEKEAFEYAAKVFGKKYPTLAYLFFIKDDNRFLPTSPDNFDKSFKRLQIDYSMTGKCSWDSYCQFIEIIREVGRVMPQYMDLAHDVRLIDAHSFVWILSGKEFINWEISRDKAKAQETATMKKQLVDSINYYVNRNGTSEIKSASEILKIAGLSDKSGNILPSDYCYNRYNKGLKGFEGPFLFEYLGPNQYKILGENYPYNGPISYKPRGENEKIIGSWTAGYVDITDENTDWKEYKEKQDKVENERIKAEDEELEEELNDLNLKGTDRLAVVKERVNQGVFRSRLLRKYKKCCLCGFDEPSLLIASHIKPWADSNPDERTDVNNGLLLCPNHDKLFDKFYISFDEKGHIVISNKLNETQQELMNVNSSMTVNMSEQTKTYMEYHRRKLLV